ncbi:MAG TPA: EVE domain-containing protein [Gemmatimonadota bacterium]|nr:EVE domain-containing protein [Gemmatimonadota bacterium]
MARRFWLVKSEPSTYSIHDLERDGSTEWWGIRNYKARNYMRDAMQVGDGVLFYHSNADPLGVYGLAEVATEAHPDSKQFEKGHRYYDPDSDRRDPTWWCVDLRHVETFAEPVTRERMKTARGLEKMSVLKRGNRLSITPVEPAEYEIVRRLAGS